MKRLIFTGLALVPCAVFAATDCRVVEYPDHYEAVCVGTEKNNPVNLRPVVPAKEATTSQGPTLTEAKAAPVPTVIGIHRAPKSVRDAAKSSRARLIKEARRGQADSPLGN
jgi:hypothetical protein